MGKGPRRTWGLPWFLHRGEPDAEEMAGTGDGCAVTRRGEEDLPQTNVGVGMSMMNIEEWKMKG